ncbi:hypothetical protein ACA910_021659 [Epithemia clementina (nom. ined.)]
MTDVQAFVTLSAYLHFQKRVDSASTSSDSYSLQQLKMRDDDDDKYTARLLPFREGTDEEPSKLFLWVLHFVDQVKLSGHPEHYEACCRYFQPVVTSLLSEEFTTAYDALPNNQALDQTTFHGLIATTFATRLTLSKVTLFCSYLLTGPKKPSDMAVDIHHNVLRKFSLGLTLLSSDPSVVPLTDAEIKKAFYLGLPVTWRTAFEQANPLVPDPARHFDITSLLQAMRSYQQLLQEKIRKHERFPRPRDDNTNTRNVRSRHSGRGGLRGGGRSPNLSGRGIPSGRGIQGYSQGGNRLPSASGDCPYRTTIPSHANHNWSNCLYNPQSGNFDQTKFNALQTRSQANSNTTAPAATSTAPSGSAHATSRRSNRAANLPPSSWGARLSTDTHANDAVSVSTAATSDNHANEVDSGLSEPLSAVLEQARRACDRSPVSNQDWTLLRNADCTVPAMSSPDWPSSGYAGAGVHPNTPIREVREQLFKIYGRGMDIAHIYDLSSAGGIGAYQQFFLCHKNFFKEVVNPDESYLTTLESYDEFYSPSSWPTAFASALSPSLSSVAESTLATVPLTLLLSRKIGGVTNDVPFRALLDSGADKMILHSRCLLPGMHPRVTNRAVNTTMGTRPNVSEIDLHDIILPEFSRTKRVSTPLWADIFDAPHSRYNIIVGRDLLSRLGVILDFQRGLSTWDNVNVAMRDCDSFESIPNLTSHFIDLYGDDSVIGDNVLRESYFQTDFQALAARQTHLSAEQRQDLLVIWQQFPDLFSGRLGLYPDRILHLQLKDDAVPVHHRAYSVPRNVTEAFKKELDRFVDLGILAPVGATEWASPHFAIPRKDGRLQFISDFRSLNAQLLRRVYPLPRIEDILMRMGRSGNRFPGHWLTPTGIRPWKKKDAAILALAPPKTVKQLRSFIGMINFYRHMYPQRSHIMAPLTALTEYNPIFHYVPGQDNVIADALSRLPLSEEEEEGAVSAATTSTGSPPQLVFNHSGKHSVFCVPDGRHDDPCFALCDADSLDSPIFIDEELIDVYLNNPAITANQPLPIDYATIYQYQQNDPALLAHIQAHPNQFTLQPFPTENPQFQLICYRQHPRVPWRIRIPDSLLAHTVNWYHIVFNHLGSQRLRETIAMHASHPDLGLYCEQAVTSCPTCQRVKTRHRHYSKLPAREVQGNPWANIAVDLIGPWTVSIQNQKLTFQALTIIDTVTNLCKLICINDKTARHVGLQLENAWLSRYPRPVRCLFDQGGEFIGQGFSQVLRNHGIKPVPLTAKNPQSNAICKQLHLTVGNVLRAIAHYDAPQDVPSATLMVDTALQTAAYSARTAIHGSLKHSPGSLAFHRDMLFDLPLIVDMEVIRLHRQQIVDERACLANCSRIFHDYSVGDKVLLRATNPDKQDLRTSPNPFLVTRVHTNGTVTIQRGPHVTKRINVRRLLPYRG